MQFSIREARQKLSHLLKAVEQGEEVEITRRGRVVARLAPLYRSEPLTDVAEALQEEYRPVVSVLTEVEMASTVARWVQMGELTQEQAANIDRVFAEDLRFGAFECAASSLNGVERLLLSGIIPLYPHAHGVRRCQP